MKYRIIKSQHENSFPYSVEKRILGCVWIPILAYTFPSEKVALRKLIQNKSKEIRKRHKRFNNYLRSKRKPKVLKYISLGEIEEMQLKTKRTVKMNEVATIINWIDDTKANKYMDFGLKTPQIIDDELSLFMINKTYSINELDERVIEQRDMYNFLVYLGRKYNFKTV